MSIKKTYTCGRCGDEVKVSSAPDGRNFRKMGGRYWHFECPRDKFERILKELENE